MQSFAPEGNHVACRAPYRVSEENETPMKRLVTTFAAATLFCGVLFAQGGPGFGWRPADGGAPPSPADRIANQVSRLTTRLELTTDQAAQITSILTSAESASDSARTTLDTDQTA